jgi:hypothetical protein
MLASVLSIGLPADTAQSSDSNRAAEHDELIELYYVSRVRERLLPEEPW